MKAKQLSVFLENKSGRLTEVTEALGAAGINLSAMSIAFRRENYRCDWFRMPEHQRFAIGGAEASLRQWRFH